ncbi:MAG: A24 family peptidase [Synergistaceae bacterium]|nr:A24 family peptidase [Synergistaceae bacterium]
MSDTILYYFAVFCYGAVMGSFINAAAMRTVADKKWWGSERSVCDSCGRILGAWELIPIVSFLVLGGKCRSCGRAIAPRHFICELWCGLLAMGYLYFFSVAPALVFALAMMPFLLFHTLTDLESGYIYDSWAIAMAVIGMAIRIWGGVPALIDGAMGAALGFCFIYLIILVSRGGMGTGDAMLMLGIGAFFGWKMTIVALYEGFMLGGLVVVPLLLMKKVSRKDAVPLGPFLAGGSALAIFTAPVIFAYIGFELSWPWTWIIKSI